MMKKMICWSQYSASVRNLLVRPVVSLYTYLKSFVFPMMCFDVCLTPVVTAKNSATDVVRKTAKDLAEEKKKRKEEEKQEKASQKYPSPHCCMARCHLERDLQGARKAAKERR